MASLIQVQIQAASNLPTVSAQIDELIRLTRLSQQAAQQASEANLRGHLLQTTAIQNLQTALQEQAATQQRTTTATRQGINQLQNDFDELGRRVNSVMGLLGIAFGAAEIKQFVGELIEAKSKVQLFEGALTQMIGSRIEANKLMADLTRIAVTSPFEVEQLMSVTLRLKALGVSTQELIPTINMLGNMAAVVGQEKLPLIAKAYTDIQSKGRLMAAETNQLAENGVNIYSLLAESMGKPRQEIIRLAQAHEISFAQVKKALQDANKEGGLYYNQMVIQSQTLAGQTANLADKFFFAKTRIADFFENGIKGGIGLLNSLLDALTGSNAAIQRTASTVAAATAAWVAARTALLLHNTQQQLATGQTDRLTLAQRLLTIGNAEAAAATAANTVTLRGLWAVMVANPLGALLTAVSLAVAAWQGYEAITTQVGELTNDTTDKLEVERAQVGILTNQVMNLNVGSQRRKELMEMLIAKYPDYFKGLSSETTGNDQLRRILDKVNDSYERRIELAKITYQQEKAMSGLKELWDQEEKLMDTARKVLSPEVMNQIKGSADALLQYLTKNRDAARALWDEDSGSFFKGLFTGKGFGGFEIYLSEVAQGIKEKEALVKSANEAEIAATKEQHKSLADLENQRYRTEVAQKRRQIRDLQDAADEGDVKAKNALKQAQVGLELADIAHKKKLQDLEGTHQDTLVTLTEKGAGRVKSINVLSAAEREATLKSSFARSYEDQLKALDAQEKAELEAANKRIVSKKAAFGSEKQYEEETRQQLLAVHQKYEDKRASLRSEQIGVLMRVVEQEQGIERQAAEAIETLEVTTSKDRKEREKQRLKEEKEANRERVKDIRESQQEIDQAERDTAQLKKQNMREEIEGRKQVFSLVMDIAGQQAGAFAPMLGMAKKVFDDFELLSRKSLNSAKADLAGATKTYEDSFTKLFEVYSTGNTQQIKAQESIVATAKKSVVEHEGVVNKVTSATTQATLGMVSMGVQLVSSLIEAMVAAEQAKYQLIHDALGRTRENMQGFFDWYAQTAQDAYQQDKTNFKGSYEDKIAMIRQFYAQQLAFQKMRDGVDAELAHFQEVAQAAQSSSASMLKGYRQYKAEKEKLQIEMETNEKVRLQQQLIVELQLRQQQLRDEYQARVDQLDDELAYRQDWFANWTQQVKDAAADRKEVLTQEHQDRLDTLQKELDKARNDRDEDLNQIRLAYDQKKQERQQDYSDAVATLKAEYDYKRELLEQAKADEAKNIEVLDRLRTEALDRYKKSEEDKLTAWRDRSLAQITDEGERALIVKRYEEDLAALHKEVEEGKLDKSKGVALAQKFLLEEQKATAEKLKEEETARLEALEKAHKSALKKLEEQQEAETNTRRAAYEVLELQLRAKIEAENKSHKDALLALEQQTADRIKYIEEQLAAVQLDILQRKTAAENSYNANTIALKRQEFEAQKAIVIAQLYAEASKLRASRGLFKDNDLENAIIAIEDNARRLEAKQFAGGTEYVDDQTRPDGVDTVPALLTKGERVLTVEQNRQIGSMSNEALVARLRQPGIVIPELSTRLKLPPVTTNGESGNTAILNELQLLRQEVRDKQLLQLNIDNGGIAAAMIAHQSKTTYHANAFQF